MKSHGPLADAAELLWLTELWLDFDEKVWSRSSVADLRQMDGHAWSNLNLMLEVVVQRLEQLQSGAKEAKRVAESLLGRQT